MGKGHIKRISAPKSWPIKRKTTKWVIRPFPGSQKLEYSLPLGVILKEILDYSTNTKETKYILNEGKILVNGKSRKTQKFPVGLMDVVTVDKDNFRLMINQKGKLVPIKITDAEAKIYLKKVINKTSLKGKKLQINFSDGTNLLSNDDYKTGDTVLFDNAKPVEKIRLEKGALIYILAGKQVGKVGVVKDIETTKGLQKTKISFTEGKNDFETLKDYAFVIGKTKPMVTLPNE